MFGLPSVVAYIACGVHFARVYCTRVYCLRRRAPLAYIACAYIACGAVAPARTKKPPKDFSLGGFHSLRCVHYRPRGGVCAFPSLAHARRTLVEFLSHCCKKVAHAFLMLRNLSFDFLPLLSCGHCSSPAIRCYGSNLRTSGSAAGGRYARPTMPPCVRFAL